MASSARPKQVGLKIPEPSVERIEVKMDDEQEAKYTQYLEAYQSALENSALNPAGKYAALGLLQRMALVAVHALLDEGPPEVQTSLPLDEQGADTSAESEPAKPRRRKDKAKWTYGNAKLARKYDSPKLRKIAEIIAGKKTVDTSSSSKMSQRTTG